MTSNRMLTDLAKDNDRLMTLMRSHMDNDEQRLFMDSFMKYLEYGHEPSAFVMDFDDVWEWIGFTTKGNASRAL